MVSSFLLSFSYFFSGKYLSRTLQTSTKKSLRLKSVSKDQPTALMSLSKASKLEFLKSLKSVWRSFLGDIILLESFEDSELWEMF